MLKLAISGCLGRLGQRITCLASQDPDLRVTALLEQPHLLQGHDTLNGVKIQSDPAGLKGCDVLIEFTTPQATMEHLEICSAKNIKMVIGTTGLSEQQIKTIKEKSRKIPIVYSANMSVGVNIFFKLTRELARSMPGSYAVRMVEAHHIHKKDAPSGTAKTLKKIIEENSGHKVPGIQSVREGEIVGDHKIIFEGEQDAITIDHHAKTRDIFAQGALVAAKFLAVRNKGLFDMQDVLDIK